MSEETTTRLSDPSVADEVFATIAALCACRVPGVAGLGGMAVERAEEALRKGGMTRGVKVTCTAEDVTVELSVDMSDKIPIPQIASSLQSEVKQWVEEMTGHRVTAVNITVDSIKIYDLQKETVGGQVNDSQAVGV